jgi:excisionase family DNA binding protein
MTNSDGPPIQMQGVPRLNDERAVCERLRIGRNTFYGLTKSGALRVIRIGRSVRVSDAEIARFISEREGKPAE